MQKSTFIFLHKYTMACLVDNMFEKILTLPFAQETSFFAVFLRCFNSGSKYSSVLGGVICDVAMRMYIVIFINGMVKSLYSFWLFYVTQQGS